MHIFLASPNSPLIFNVDAHVGERAQNSREDVLLVQFLLYCVVQKLKAVNEQGRATQARVRAVPLNGVCDAATIDGIRAWQESAKPKAVVDGRVSPRPGDLLRLGPLEHRRAELHGSQALPAVLATAPGLPEVPAGAVAAHGDAPVSPRNRGAAGLHPESHAPRAFPMEDGSPLRGRRSTWVSYSS